MVLRAAFFVFGRDLRCVLRHSKEKAKALNPPTPNKRERVACQIFTKKRGPCVEVYGEFELFEIQCEIFLVF